MIVRCPRCTQWLRYSNHLVNPTLRCNNCNSTFPACNAVPVSDEELRAAGESPAENGAPGHAAPHVEPHRESQPAWGGGKAADQPTTSPIADAKVHPSRPDRSPARPAFWTTAMIVGGVIFVFLNIIGWGSLFSRPRIRVRTPVITPSMSPNAPVVFSPTPRESPFRRIQFPETLPGDVARDLDRPEIWKKVEEAAKRASTPEAFRKSAGSQ